MREGAAMLWILLALALFAFVFAGAHPAAAADAWINDAALCAWALAKTLFWIGSCVCLLIITLSLGAYLVALLLNRHKLRGDLYDLIDLVASICLGIWSALFVLLGVSILGIQLFLWAKTGSWNGVSVATALWLIGFDLSSIYFPNDWKGLATIVSWLLAIPLSLSALLVGAYAFFEASVMRASYREGIRAEQQPQPGDPDYLDWANRRGKYAGRSSVVGR
jgi:hypothetical protein